MKFEKGQSGNPAGRTPGVKNKTSEQIRKLVLSALSEYLDADRLLNDLKKLDSPQRLMAVDRLLKHVLPPPVEPFMRLSDSDFQRLVNELEQRKKITYDTTATN